MSKTIEVGIYNATLEYDGFSYNILLEYIEDNKRFYLDKQDLLDMLKLFEDQEQRYKE